MEIRKGYNPNTNGHGSSKSHARSAAIERQLAKYLELVCGHYSTREMAMIYGTLKVLGRIQIYCERCGDFRDIRPPKKPKELPQEPMF